MKVQWNSWIWTFALLLCLGWTLIACARGPIQVGFTTSRFLNLDDTGAPLPVVVRIYSLRAPERFQQSDFRSLWKEDQEVLGPDLIARQEITLQPNARATLQVPRQEGLAYLGIMALFRKPQGERWRQLIPVGERRVREIQLTVHERSVKVARIK